MDPLLKDARPRRYGPFWVATTLIFVSAVTGNYASYLSYNAKHAATPGGGDAVWYYDINKVRSALVMQQKLLYFTTHDLVLRTI